MLAVHTWLRVVLLFLKHLENGTLFCVVRFLIFLEVHSAKQITCLLFVILNNFTQCGRHMSVLLNFILRWLGILNARVWRHLSFANYLDWMHSIISQHPSTFFFIPHLKHLLLGYLVHSPQHTSSQDFCLSGESFSDSLVAVHFDWCVVLLVYNAFYIIAAIHLKQH